MVTVVICLDLARRIEIIELRKAIEALRKGDDIAKAQAAAQKSRSKWAAFSSIVLILSIGIFSAIDSEVKKAEYNAMLTLDDWLLEYRNQHVNSPETGILVQKLRLLESSHEDGEVQLLCAYGILGRYRVRITTHGNRVRFHADYR